MEEIGVEEGVGGDSATGVVDDVFEEPINVNGGENMGDIAVSGANNVEVPNVGVGAGGAVTVNISSEAKLEGPGGDNLIEGVGEVAGDVSVMDKMEVEGGEVQGRGAEGLVGEKPKEVIIPGEVLGGDDDNTMGGVYGMDGLGTEGGVGEEGAEGGATVSGSEESSGVEPVHHIPRWRLREILAHAEGKCILLV